MRFVYQFVSQNCMNLIKIQSHSFTHRSLFHSPNFPRPVTNTFRSICSFLGFCFMNFRFAAAFSVLIELNMQIEQIWYSNGIVDVFWCFDIIHGAHSWQDSHATITKQHNKKEKANTVPVDLRLNWRIAFVLISQISSYSDIWPSFRNWFAFLVKTFHTAREEWQRDSHREREWEREKDKKKARAETE